MSHLPTLTFTTFLNSCFQILSSTNTMAAASYSTSTPNWIKINHQSRFTSSPRPRSGATSISYRNSKTTNSAIQTRSTLNFPEHSPIESHSPSSSTSPPHKLNLFQKMAAMAFDAVENTLTSLEKKKPLPKTIDPKVQLVGNFAPVPEQPITHDLPVIGKIPEHIQGVYLRNGANPLFKPTSGHHLFDGDGMISAVKFENGSASYASRFTETQRLVQERAAGKPVFPKPIGELHGQWGIIKLILFYARGLCGLVDVSRGVGVANAGLVYFNNRLLAMSEEDFPYHVRVTRSGDLETVGRYDFDNQLKCSMIAHPKVDLVSGELFALSYNVITKPYLKYFRFSPDGEKSADVDIHLEKPTMVHDFAITENFVVVPDHQVVFNIPEMIIGGSPVAFDKQKVSRFGVLNKYDTDGSRIKWIETPDCFCFHLWNAWELPESDEVIVIGSCMTPADSIFNECNEKLKIVLTEIRLNLKTGESSQRAILSAENEVNLEVGMVNKNLLGRKTKYAYLAVAEPWPKVSGFAKVNLFTGEVCKYIYGDSKYGGEPLFVPSCCDNDEDDGHILAFVHDESAWESELQIVNAKTLKLVSTVKLPVRVPYGFHGTFITADELATQA